MTMKFVKIMAMAGVAVVFGMGTAYAGGPAVIAASKATAVSGAVAGGGGGGGGGSAKTGGDKTIAGAVGFPASPNPSDCTLVRGFGWNLFYYTTDSERCVEEGALDSYMLAVSLVGDKSGEELTPQDLAILNRIALGNPDSCRSLQAAPSWGGYVTCNIE